MALLVSGNDAETCIPPSAPDADVKKSAEASTTDSAGEDDNFLDAHESFTQYDGILNFIDKFKLPFRYLINTCKHTKTLYRNTIAQR